METAGTLFMYLTCPGIDRQTTAECVRKWASSQATEFFSSSGAETGFTSLQPSWVCTARRVVAARKSRNLSRPLNQVRTAS
ncbi:hypothetical protein BaRGS_00010427, partial [Batillaria attramentaria]